MLKYEEPNIIHYSKRRFITQFNTDMSSEHESNPNLETVMTSFSCLFCENLAPK